MPRDLADGDYETSSEGAIRGMQDKQIKEIFPKNPKKTDSRSGRDDRNLELREKKSSKELGSSSSQVVVLSSLRKSKSMPVLMNTFSSEEDVVLTSQSSTERNNKLKMIMARTGPITNWDSNSVSTDTFRVDLIDEFKQLESKTMLSVVQSTNDSPSSAKKMTPPETPKEKEAPKEEENSGCSVRTTEDSENFKQTQENDDLIDIAKNPNSSIKSFFIPPIPEGEICMLHFRQQPRISKETEVLEKIRGEFDPLNHQLNEIKGKCRTLHLITPSVLSKNHYSNQFTSSSNNSGYSLHKTDTFGRDSKMQNIIGPASYRQDNKNLETRSYNTMHDKIAGSSHDYFFTNNPTSRSVSVANKRSYSIMLPPRSCCKCVGRDVSSNVNNWQLQDNESYASTKNLYFESQDRFNKDLSGSLVPLISSSCYKCRRNRAFDPRKLRTSSYYNELEFMESRNSYMRQNEMPSTSSRPIKQNYWDDSRLRKEDNTSHTEVSVGSGRLMQTLNTSTVTSRPLLRVISVNTCLGERCSKGIVTDKNLAIEEESTTRQNSKRSSDNSIDRLRDQSVSTSLTVIGTDGGSKTGYVNYTHMNVQTSLVSIKKDQDATTSMRDYPQNESSDDRREENLRDADVQCSDTNPRKVVVRRSMATLAKPSESAESQDSSLSKNLKSIEVTKTDQKVVIVPILFTDGIPDPPKAPLFHFAKSRCRLPKTSHHFVKLDKRSSSVTQNSDFSGNSGESLAMESSYFNQRLMSRTSGMSMSCVSRTGSSLRCKNPSHLSNTIKTMSEHHHSRGRHSHSSKAHSEPTKRMTKKVIHGMRSSPEEFLCDT